MFIAAVLLLCGSAHAESVKLVSGDDYAPYADSQLPEGGMVTDLVKKAFGAMHKSVTVGRKPWARGLEETRRGDYAATFPYLKNAAREESFLYSDEIIAIRSSAFVRAGSKRLDFSDIGRLEGSIYCLPQGWAPTPRLAEMVKTGQIKVESPPSISSCAKMVARGRADYFVYGDEQVASALTDGDISDGTIIKADFPPLSVTPLFLLASKSVAGSQALLDSFNKGLKAIRQNGIYDKTVKAHSLH